jgi:hypothetical protein
MAVALYDTRFLDSARINRIIETRSAMLELMRPRTFLDRLTMVPAEDDEITGRATFKRLAADIIADDQKAVVYESGRVDLFITAIPNVKIGQAVPQSKIKGLERFRQADVAGENALLTWEQNFAAVLMDGVLDRLNMMACAMFLDTFTYNRWGVNLGTVTWGMPSNLKVTPSTPWSTAATATPLDDIQALDQVDNDNYGAGPFDRITMSSQAFRYLTATTQFQSRASMVAGVNFQLAAGNLSLKDDPAMRRVLMEIMGKEIVIDDTTYREANAAGATTATRVLPANKVVLDRKANGPAEMDVGNAVVTESIVSGVDDGQVVGASPFAGGTYGPVGYYTRQAADLNPPGFNGWCVARAFPESSSWRVRPS